MKTPVVQYVRPNGRRVQGELNRPKDIAEKTTRLWSMGYEVSLEVLTTGQVAMYVSNDEEDLNVRVSENGPEVLTEFDKMIEESYEHLCCTP